MTKTLTVAAMLTATILMSSGCGKSKSGDDDDKKGGVTIDQSSPEKVAESFKAAAKAKDWKGMFACGTDQSHAFLLSGAIFTSMFSTEGDEAKEKSFEDILEKHGISKGTNLLDDPTAKVKDKLALFSDLMEWQIANITDEKKRLATQMAEMELSSFSTKDDKATADVVFDGKKKRQPADFKKVDGKWYFDNSSGRRKKGPRGPKFPKKTS